MNKIHILPQEIVSKIAAGEVVERPASVVKELVENSLDAQATSIEVWLKGAGKTLIRIKDNGRGIPEEDLDTIFNRHATSKINSLDDLYQITSLGFRGEALYSVSAISDVTLASKAEGQDCGWEMRLRAGQRLSKKPEAMPTGTDISVKELFFNTPARRKFLKSDSTELNRVLDIFIPYTLLYPGSRFQLAHEDRKLLDLPPAGSLPERIRQGLRLETKYIIEERQDFSRENISLYLALGDINIQRTRRDMQFIFINQRPVENKSISFHLNNIYRRVFSPGIYPFFCVYLSLPPEELDVNIHPAKREVRIKNENEVLSRIRILAETALAAKSKARQAEKNIFSLPASNAEPINAVQARPSSARNAVSEQEIPSLFKDYPALNFRQDSLKEKLRESRFIGGLLNKYLLFEAGDSLLLIDQHAANERINFEKLKYQIETGKIEIQHLISPLLLKLSPQEILSWPENKEALEKAGFNCSLFDKETLAIHSHPSIIRRPEESARNLISGENRPRISSEELARIACHSSLTTGYNLKREEAEYQRSQLLLCQEALTCPHGRPTVIEISEANISRQFLRG